eukprot:1324954-Rhodomonas_salina.1
MAVLPFFLECLTDSQPEAAAAQRLAPGRELGTQVPGYPGSLGLRSTSAGPRPGSTAGPGPGYSAGLPVVFKDSEFSGSVSVEDCRCGSGCSDSDRRCLI